MTNKTVFRVVLCFFFISLVLFGCTSKSKERKIETLTIAFPEWVGYGPLYLAQEKGFCKEEGIKLDFVDEQLDSARRDAFEQGMLDVEAGTLDLLVSKVSRNVPIKTVLEIDSSFGSDGIVAVKNIQKLEDLIGRRVALSRDEVGETFLSYLFYKKGLSIDRINIVSKRPEDVARSFLDGEADACVSWEPWLSKALARQGSHLLTSTKEYPGVIIDTLNVRDDLIKNDPASIKGLMRAWFKAVNFYNEQPAAASEIIAKHYGMTAKEYRRQIEGLKWVDYDHQLQSADLDGWVDVFNVIVKIKLKNGRINRELDAQKYIDHTLLETLYENSK